MILIVGLVIIISVVTAVVLLPFLLSVLSFVLQVYHVGPCSFRLSGFIYPSLISEGRYIRQYPDNCSLLSFTGRGVTNTGTTIMKHLFSRMKPSTSCGFIPCLTSLLCLLAIILVSPILLELYFLRDRRISQPASDRPGSCTSALPSSYIACMGF